MGSRLAVLLGLGRFGGGDAAARYLLGRGFRVRVVDRANAQDLAAQVKALQPAGDLEWALGTEDPAVLDGAELVVVNPAVPPNHPLLAAADQRGIVKTQEINLFLEGFPGRVVLVTGTNGKSTTATLLAAALRRSGIDTLLGGNVGHSLLNEVSRWPTSPVAVVEISSFQLERLDPARHQVSGAVFARVTKDHLDRHGTLGAYHAAKAVAALVARDFVVHQADDAVAAGFATSARLRVGCHQSAPGPGHIGCDDGWVVAALADSGPVLHCDALQLVGAFQLENVMAASAAAMLLGAARHATGIAMVQQKPLRYRLQLLLARDGIELWDNAVSTEVLSTLSALQTLRPPIHWVAGGKSKDGDYAGVARAVVPYVASAHLFGMSAPGLAHELQGRVPVAVHERAEQALNAAWSTAQPGSRVLFSPAFASFDQYPNFRARAEAFHAWATRLQQPNTNRGALGAETSMG